jgi:two-component system OmpR family response regulator
MAAKKILIVDDDPSIRDVLRFTLEKSGFAVTETANGAEALVVFPKLTPDLLILDILMPEMDGTDVCREIRKTSTVPIIFLTSLDEEADRIIGLELGGDDYITKPFSPRELLARVKAVLRRFHAAESFNPKNPDREAGAEDIRNHGKLGLNLTRFEVTWDGVPIALTAMEFHLLKALFDHPTKVYSRDELMQKAYDDNIVVTDRTIDSHIRRIRKKFAEHPQCRSVDPVETVHGFGYRLAAKQSG